MPLSFDASYYMKHRPDVLNAYVNGGSEAGTGLSWPAFAAQHYNIFGWKEGSNPNAIFNTSEYLAANLDVLAAGVNPFTHYLAFGATEGRAPSDSFIQPNNFDWQTYLDENPDLGVAGIDTAEEAYGHYVVFGQFEDRAGTPAKSNPGETYNLTPGPDTYVGTDQDDTINALPVSATGANSSTLTAFDNIDGGKGRDTLNVFVNGANNNSFPATASVKNVEIVNVNWMGNAAANGLTNVANYQGVEQLWQAGSAANVSNATDDVTLGFRDVDATRLNDTITMKAGQTTANIALDNSVGFLSTSGATTANVSGNKAAGVFTLNVNNTGAATAVTVNTAVATTVTTGSGTVTSLDASGSKGAITYTTSGDVSVKTGSGNDTVTLDATQVANATISLGKGDDTLLGVGAVTANATGTYDGGEGRDTVAASLVNAGNAAKFVNFEVLGLNKTGTLDTNLLTGSQIESLSLMAHGGTYTNVNLDQGLFIATHVGAGATTLGFEGAAGGNDSYTVTFARDAGTTTPTAVNTVAGQINLDAIENINVVSGGTNAWNAIQLSSNTAETVTVTGSQALALTFAPNFGSHPAGNEVTAIDASGATGAVSINIANVTADPGGLTVSGGSADDMLIAFDFAATFTGNGGADVFNLIAATYSGPGGVITTITDFSAGDVIDFKAATGGTGTALGASVDIGGVTTLADALLAAFAAASEATWFQYGGNTYVVHDSATDHVVQLTGLLDLSTSLYDSAGGTLAFA